MRILIAALWIVISLNVVTAKTIRVGKTQTVQTITEATALADDGDTVLVSSGLYKEKSIYLHKRVYLIGIDHPVIDGENKTEIITVTADGTVVEGFRLINSGTSSIEDYAAILLSTVKNVTVRNNILENNFFGIFLKASTNCRVEKNTISSNARSESSSGNGIHCWKSDSLVILDNKIDRHRDGIYFEFVTNSIIARNISTNNIRYGLHFMFSHQDDYIQNYFKGNGAGVAVMYSRQVNMIYNFFLESWGDAAYGLYLKEISDGRIEHNYFEKNTTAVVAEGSSRLKIQHSSFKNNGWAFRIQSSCMDLDILENNFTGNSFDVATNGTLMLNRFSNNYWDKYEGYDLDRDGTGDVPYRPVSMFSMIVERNPTVMMLFRSFITTLMDKTEKVIPGLTPENLKDDEPRMKPLQLL